MVFQPYKVQFKDQFKADLSIDVLWSRLLLSKIQLKVKPRSYIVNAHLPKSSVTPIQA